MRFLSVGSHLCARASFRPPLAGLPLPSASSYICPTIGHYRYSYRGLSPHKFMPMSGVHKALQPTVLPPLRCGKPAAEENNGWEFHIVRKSEQRRASDGKRRTVGEYQIFHDGVKQEGAGLSGTVAETRGSAPTNLLATIAASRKDATPCSLRTARNMSRSATRIRRSTFAKPKPGLELKETGQRAKRSPLSTPAKVFSRASADINPCTSLPDAAEMIDFVPSRKRVIAIINDLKAYVGDTFPTTNGKRIPNAFVVIDGEPQF